MALGGQLNISVNVTGAEQIAMLKEHTASLNAALKDTNFIRKMAIEQTRNETAQLSLSNKLLGEKAKLSDQEISRMALLMNTNEQLARSNQNRLTLEREAWKVKISSAQQGIQLTMEEARVVAESNMKQAIAIREAEAALKAKRRAMMQASISLFVMNISANQLVSSLKPLVKGNEEATKAIEGYQAMLNMSLAPMQAYMALKQLQINLEKQHAAAVTGVIAGMSTAYFWYAALTAKSREMRMVMGALAGIMTVLALRQAFVAITAWQAAVAQATGRAVVGDMSGWVKIGIGMGIAAAVGAAIAGLTAPRAQTLTGQGKYVREGGLAKLDPGEIVTRPSGGARGIGGGNIQYHLHFPPGTQVTSTEARRFGKVFAQQQNMGMGRTTSRSVVANG